MIRSKFVLLVAAAAALIFTLTGTSARAASFDSNGIVVMISLDGLAAYYLDDPKAEMPNVRALAETGARAASMRAATPTVTWPNHTTLVTGASPARHGVVGNNYYDRTTHQHVTLILDPVFDKDQIVKIPTLYDVAKSNGMKTAAIRWPATRNAHALDWTIPEVKSAEMLLKYSTPSVVNDCNKAGIPFFQNDPATRKPRDFGEPADDFSTKAFNLILKKHHPQFALLHLAQIDHTEHAKGPKSPEAYAAIKVADEQVGEIWHELQRDYPGKATLFVVSDHGFSKIKQTILPNVILRKAGLVKLVDKKTTTGPVHMLVQGGSGLVYIEDQANRDKLMKQVEKAFRGVKGVEKVVGPEELKKLGVADPKDDPHAPDMIVFAKDGYVFGDTAAGDLPFVDKPERRGSHGHDSALPNLHATFVACGNGIKPGTKLGEIDNKDVAPTIAKLLHISLPDAEGKPLPILVSE